MCLQNQLLCCPGTLSSPSQKVLLSGSHPRRCLRQRNGDEHGHVRDREPLSSLRLRRLRYVPDRRFRILDHQVFSWAVELQIVGSTWTVNLLFVPGNLGEWYWGA